MLSLVCPREKRESGVELNHDAPKTPHVDLLVVGEEPQYDVRSSVESTLDVSVHNFVLQAPTSKIGNNDSALVFALEQDVLWLEVTVDDP